MAHRSFIDSSGVSWDVWEVRPHGERRAGGERRQLSLDDPRVDPPVLEQRRGVERRRTAGDDGSYLTTRASGDGWLTFDSGRERRRLAPIPTTWATASPAELAVLCARATIAAASRPRVAE